jgi:class 3 adenylate cyclase
VVEPKIGEHSGRIVNTTGDGIPAESPSVVGAVRCAAAWQRAMTAREAGRISQFLDMVREYRLRIEHAQ